MKYEIMILYIHSYTEMIVLKHASLMNKQMNL